jgi:hypothetical protein
MRSSRLLSLHNLYLAELTSTVTLKTCELLLKIKQIFVHMNQHGRLKTVLTNTLKLKRKKSANTNVMHCIKKLTKNACEQNWWICRVNFILHHWAYIKSSANVQLIQKELYSLENENGKNRDMSLSYVLSILIIIFLYSTIFWPTALRSFQFRY